MNLKSLPVMALAAVLAFSAMAPLAACSSGSSAKTATASTKKKSSKKKTEKTSSTKKEKSSEEHKVVNTMSQQPSSSPKSVKAFVDAFNAASATPYVEDATFDPSDASSPYSPHRSSSPVYKGGSGSHGTCGALSVTVISGTNGVEVDAVMGDYDYQSVADFARAAILAMKPDVDQTSLDAALDKFVNDNLHMLDFGSIDSSLLEGSASGKEFFLRVK